MNMTARLVPGATTGARYYRLHGYVPHVPQERELSDGASLGVTSAERYRPARRPKRPI